MTTPQTPEERREAQIDGAYRRWLQEMPVGGNTTEAQRRAFRKQVEEALGESSFVHEHIAADLDLFLAYFDEHEPKVALAIREGIHESVPEEALRYGVKRKSAHRMLCDIQAGGDCDCDGVDLFQINSPEAREAMKNDGKWENDIPMTPRELQHVELLRKAGCSCHLPLLGYRLSVGPRCRLCNTQAQEQR